MTALIVILKLIILGNSRECESQERIFQWTETNCLSPRGLFNANISNKLKMLKKIFYLSVVISTLYDYKHIVIEMAVSL